MGTPADDVSGAASEAPETGLRHVSRRMQRVVEVRHSTFSRRR